MKKRLKLAWRSECGKYIVCRTYKADAKTNKFFLSLYSLKKDGLNKLPFGLDNLLHLKELGFKLRGDLEECLAIFESSAHEIKPIKVKDVPLYKYQEEGVGLLDYFNGNALLSDEMGLGKTIQAIAWAKHNPKVRPILVTVPNCVKTKWQEEIEKYIPDAVVEKLYGKKGSNLPNADFYIVNYDIVADWDKYLKKKKIQAIFIDECHLIKNRKASRTKTVRAIGRKCKHVIAISGTPLLSRPMEIYNALYLINSGLFANRQSFGLRYCGGKKGYKGIDFSGSSNENELYTILTKTCLIRRLKKDVLQDLPAEPIPNIIRLPLTNVTTYNKAKKDVINYLQGFNKSKAESAKKAQHLVKIETLKQLCNKGKMSAVFEWIDSSLEQIDKLVVYCWHKEVVDQLYNRYKKIAISPRKDGPSDICATKFNNDKKIKIFIGNIKADGAGIDLVSAADLAFVELGWTPGDMKQARDRIYRIGQKAKRLNLTYLIGEDTIEEDILQLLMDKQKIIDAVIDGKNTGMENDSILKELIRKLKR